jgi:nitrous oxide reductase accessory protein NosL
MKLQLRKHLVTCALLAGVGLAAQAQTQAQPAPTAPAASGAKGDYHHGHHDPAKRAERMNKRLGELKQKLQLTTAQEPAWTSLTNALQPTAKQRPDRDAIARMSTPDRIDHMRSLRSQRNAEMDRRADAAKAFYAQLDAEQKKTFDAETARMFQGGGRMHRHHG